METIMISREEFSKERSEQYQEMIHNSEIQALSLEILEKGIPFGLPYQTLWFGEPIIQLPQDLFAIQEIVYETRPDFILEIGTAWAGSLLFYASLLEVLGGKKVIGVDIYIPDDLVLRIENKGDISSRIELISGSSLDEKVLSKIKEIIGDSKKLFVHLDSNHTTAHVLKELEIYSGLLDVGMYILCGDTHVELLSDDAYKNKEYSRGNNPMIALRKFLASTKGSEFEINEFVNGKYLLTLNPSGFLKRKNAP